MATLRKRGTSWQVQVRRQGQSAISRTFRRKADAETWARQMEALADRAELPQGMGEIRTLTVGGLLRRYACEKTPKKRGAAQESNRLERFQRAEIADIHLNRLTPSHVASYRDARLANVSGGTVRRELNILSHVFEIALQEWAILCA